MVWSYSGDPSSSDKDLARYLIGDTIQSDPYLQDEEINFMITQKGSAHGAAPFLATNILSRLARQADYWIGPEKVYASKRYAQYKDLIKELRRNWVNSNAAPIWEGSNNDGLGASFSVGIFDNPRGGDGNYGSSD